MGRFFRCELEFEERPTDRSLANEERDRQIALLGAAVLRLEAGQAQLRAALRTLLDCDSAASPTDAQIHRAEQDAAIESLDRMVRDNEAFLRTFNDGFDSAERRKQALKARIRQMVEQRRARYASFW
jgi:hypothetical protein